MGRGTQEEGMGTAVRAEAVAGRERGSHRDNVAGEAAGGRNTPVGLQRAGRGSGAPLLLQDSLLSMEPGPTLEAEAGPGLDSDSVPLLGRSTKLSGPPLDSRYPVDPR